MSITLERWRKFEDRILSSLSLKEWLTGWLAGDWLSNVLWQQTKLFRIRTPLPSNFGDPCHPRNRRCCFTQVPVTASSYLWYPRTTVSRRVSQSPTNGRWWFKKSVSLNKSVLCMSYDCYNHQTGNLPSIHYQNESSPSPAIKRKIRKCPNELNDTTGGGGGWDPRNYDLKSNNILVNNLTEFFLTNSETTQKPQRTRKLPRKRVKWI